jgi:glutaredoxin 3
MDNSLNKISAIIWTKSTCPYCIKAKLLLESKNIPYEENDLLKGAKIEDMRKAVPDAKTVPQIFLIKGDKKHHIGGYTDLAEYFSKLEKNNLFYINLNRAQQIRLIDLLPMDFLCLLHVLYN